MKLNEDETTQQHTIATRELPYSSAVNLAADLAREGIQISTHSTLTYLHRTGFISAQKGSIPNGTSRDSKIGMVSVWHHHSWQNT